MAYLLQWVMIYSFGINTDFENRSQFDPLHWNAFHGVRDQIGIYSQISIYSKKIITH